MRNSIKKLFAIMLTLLMILTLMPASAKTGYAADDAVSASGMIPGSSSYELYTENTVTAGDYLIVSAANGTGYALNRSGARSGNGSNRSYAGQAVTVSDGQISKGFTNEANCIWTFTSSGEGFKIHSGNVYLDLDSNSILGGTASNNTTIRVSKGSGNTWALRYVYYEGILSDYYYALRYNSGWRRAGDDYTVYLFKEVTTEESPVTLSVTPASAVINAGSSSPFTATVTLDDAALAANACDISWTSSNTSVATVDANGVVTGLADGNATITVTLNTVNGTAPAMPVVVNIPVTVRSTSEEGPYAGLEPADVYPEYPEPGAVRINKTASSDYMADYGISEVELDVAGISVKTGVDVVLVVDVSNSMGWSLENAGGANDSARRPTGNQTTKLQDAMTAADNFSKILLQDNTGAESDNTVSFVTFAGYDREHSVLPSDQNAYVDSVMTVFTGEKSYAKAHTSFMGTTITGTGNQYTLTVTDNNGNQLVRGENRGNTNYDYGFYQASQAVAAIQGAYDDYAASSRETYIVFMTDGAPSHYNATNINQNQKDRDRIPGTNTNYAGTYNSQNAWTEYITNNDNQFANSLYNSVDGNFYAIGFDLAHGGFGAYQWTEAQLTTVLEGMVTGAEIPVMATANAAQLNAFYESLAHQIKLAGEKAQVQDVMSTDFTLQMAAQVGGSHQVALPDELTPKVTIKTYDLYTTGNAPSPDLIGSRTGTYQEIETVTFNAAGTQAYSDQIGGGSTNIMTTESDGSLVITAKYFTYKKTVDGLETFDWNIGDITDKEIALYFLAYLKGAMEGEADGSLRYTNEEATLDYVDIFGKHATQIFPRPVAIWGEALTDYEYYLVNKAGQPVNRAGVVIPFANRIKVGNTIHNVLHLNEDKTIIESTYYAVNGVPEDYVLYDNGASYVLRAASGGVLQGILHINDPTADASLRDQTGAQTTIPVTWDELRYTYSLIAFGVRYDMVPGMSLVNDTAVLDYGKPVDLDVLANDSAKIPEGFTATLAGFAEYAADTDMTQVYAEGGAETITTDNGVYTMSEGKVHFEMSRFLNTVDKVFCVVKLQNNNDENDVYYMYEELAVMPANNIYYEDDFVSTSSDSTVGIVYTGSWSVEGTSEGNVETANTTVHGGWVDGDDTGLSDDGTYSDGSTHVATKGATALFTFTGTGVDIYTRTNADVGKVRAQLFKGEEAKAAQLTKSLTMDNTSKSGDYYQIPTLFFNGLDFGTYTVKLTVGAVNGNSTYYLDGIRIYNPIQDQEEDATVRKAYGNAELKAVFTVARDLLTEGSAAFLDEVFKLYYDDGSGQTIVQVDGEDVVVAAGGTYNEDENAIVDNAGSLITDIDGRVITASLSADVSEPVVTATDTEITVTVPKGYAVGTVSAGPAVGDYTSSAIGKIAPKNEVYLDEGQTVVIQTEGGSPGYYIGLKALSGTPVVSVTDTDTNKELTITHSTDLYYVVNPNTDGQIIIANGEGGMLSITKLRVCGLPDTEGDGTKALSPAALPERVSAFKMMRSAAVAEEALTEEEAAEVQAEETEAVTEETAPANEKNIVIENPESFEETKVSETENVNNSAAAQTDWVSNLLKGLSRLFSRR